MDQETRQAFETLEARFLERLGAMETKLLGAFFSWQSAVDQKLHEMPILQTRVGLLEERVTKLERKNLEDKH